jgi:hypothetical protein
MFVANRVCEAAHYPTDLVRNCGVKHPFLTKFKIYEQERVNL